MNIVLLGPPGAGKGTVAVQLKEKLNIPHISTGDLFRYHIKGETPLGKKVKALIDSGELVPDEITTEMVKLRFTEPDIKNGVILDGYPRTLGQAKDLESFSQIDAVLNYELSEGVIIERLSGRRLCRNCGKGYHTQYLKPKNDSICDDCGGELYIREDDKEASIVNRLQVYKSLTEPLIAFYSEKGCLKNINADQSPELVADNSLKILNNLP